jgi:DNA-binding IclR family transcriptional regulator
VRFGVHLSYYTQAGIKMADADPEYPPPQDEVFVNRHLYACALGKLLLAEARPRDFKEPPAALAGLTPTAVVLRSQLARQLDDVRTLGYALQVGELSPHSACLAVPVRNPAGAIVAGLALSGRVDQREALQRQLETLRECARRLAPLLA